MTQAVTLLFCVLGGAALGVVFFGGLWWTVQRIPSARHPGLLMSASLLLRGLLAAGGLYWLFDGQIERLLAALLGMLLVRQILKRRLGPASQLREA